MVVVDEAEQHAMEAADRSRTRGIIEMSTTVPDPPRVGGVKAMPETGKESPRRNAGIVSKGAT